MLVVIIQGSYGIWNCPAYCPTYNQPVCASNGVTYSNGCHMDCHNILYKPVPPIEAVAYGECPNCNMCPNNFAPLCGSDGRVYKNTCHLICYSLNNVKYSEQPIFVKHVGSCQ